MSYTKPPCWQNGSDCSNRYIACQSSCDEFQAWLAIHAEEKAERDRDVAKEVDASNYRNDRVHRLTRGNKTGRKVGQR